MHWCIKTGRDGMRSGMAFVGMGRERDKTWELDYETVPCKTQSDVGLMMYHWQYCSSRCQ